MIPLLKIAHLPPIIFDRSNSPANPQKAGPSQFEDPEIRRGADWAVLCTASGAVTGLVGYGSAKLLGVTGMSAAAGGVLGMGSAIYSSFGAGAFIGCGINYLPNVFGAKKTVGDHLGDAAVAVFGPCDRHGTFFKVGQFLGLT